MPGRASRGCRLFLARVSIIVVLFFALLPERSMSMLQQHLKHPHTLFVDGTLKRGFYNHNVYLRRAEDNCTAKYLGTAITNDKFALKVLGPRCIPALLEDPTDYSINGEVYAVSDDVLEAMDLLEGVAVGHYFRRQRGVQMQAKNEKSKNEDCWVYLQTPKGDRQLLEKEPSYDTYTEDLHNTYVPPTAKPDPKILKLLEREIEKASSGGWK